MFCCGGGEGGDPMHVTAAYLMFHRQFNTKDVSWKLDSVGVFLLFCTQNKQLESLSSGWHIICLPVIMYDTGVMMTSIIVKQYQHLCSRCHISCGNNHLAVAISIATSSSLHLKKYGLTAETITPHSITHSVLPRLPLILCMFQGYRPSMTHFWYPWLCFCQVTMFL